MSADVDLSGSAEAPDGPSSPPGRLARIRARAESAGDRYQDLAQRRPLLGLPLVFMARYTSREGILLASAVAFRLFLWIMPFALLVAGISAGLSDSDGSNIETAARAAGVTSAARQEIARTIGEGRRSWPTAVIIGALLFLWTTRTLIRNLIMVNAHAWQAPRGKRTQKEMAMTTLAFAGGWAAILAIVLAATSVDEHRPDLRLAATLGVVLATAAIWLFISLRLPDLRHSWTDLIPGSLVVGVGLSVLHLVSLVYIPRRLHHSSHLYGSLGLAAVILAWMLIIGQVLVSGALINSVWADYRAGRHSQ